MEKSLRWKYLYVQILIMLLKLFLTFEYVNEILNRDHSNEVLSCVLYKVVRTTFDLSIKS